MRSAISIFSVRRVGLWLLVLAISTFSVSSGAEESGNGQEPGYKSDEALDFLLEDTNSDTDSVEQAESNENDTTQEESTAAEVPDGEVSEGQNVTAVRPKGIEEIIVTATKREESSREIAGTVAVVSGEQLEEMDARELTDYLKLVPGITLQESETGNGRSISIRGIGPQPGGNTTTGVLIENVAMNDPYQNYLVPDLDPFDLHNLEVLKGPQGTLFGASALNGAIRYVFAKPEFEEWYVKGFANQSEIRGHGEGSSYGAALNMPVTEDIAFRVAGVKQEYPGLYDDVNANGKNIPDADTGEKSMFRVLGSWNVTDRLSISGFILDQRGTRDNLSVANNHDGEFHRTNTPGPSTSVQEFDVKNLEVNYDFDRFTFVYETSTSDKYLEVDFDGSAVLELAAQAGIETLRLKTVADTEAKAQEFRFLSPADNGPWKWIAGYYLYEYQAIASLDAPLANTGGIADLLSQLEIPGVTDALFNLLIPSGDAISIQYVSIDPVLAEEKSLFGEISRYFFSDTLEIALGLRYYRQELSAQSNVSGITSIIDPIVGFSGTTELKEKGYNPKISIKYRWSEDTLFYAATARGFQFGGINSPAPVPTDNVYSLTYKPSDILSSEIGVRTDWFDNTLQIDATLFYIDWNDMQLKQDVPSGNTDYTDNVSRARSRGIETGIRWLTPIDGLMMFTTASYIEATVREKYTTSDGIEIEKGQELPASPKKQYAVTLNYSRPLFGFLIGGFNATYAYIGPGFSNVQHDLEIYDFGTLDLGVNIKAPVLPFSPELSFAVTNVTDEIGFIGGRFTGAAGMQLGNLAVYNRPRTYTMRLGFQF